MRICSFHVQFALIAALAGAFLAGGAAASGRDFFETRIRPVLADYCYECHSGRSETLRSGLRVDSREALLLGGERGPAIRPGRPEESLLYQAVTHRHPKLAMPDKRPQLSEAVLEDIRRWIGEGAIWPETKPRTPDDGIDLAVRKARLPRIWETPTRQVQPQVADPDWPRSDLDYFILAGLEEAELAPAADADRRTWLRRVSFALTGLPPSAAALAEFLEDTSAEAREKVVDTLLASPHFGERWARHWMDLMRYAESRGHESDYVIPNAYHYRDYLIRAFNANLPYDRFVMEHVAGDLLVPARLNPGNGANESVLATGWAFLGEEVHSPVDIRQDECDRIDNKVDVFSKTFLGLTVSCARCHDHKFDAVRARDYYALAGFFLSSSYRQVRFESMEQNRLVAEELAAIRRDHRQGVSAVWAGLAEQGLDELERWLGTAAKLVRTDGGEGLVQERSEEQILRWREYLIGAMEDPADSFSEWARQLAGRKTENGSRSQPELALPAGARIVADYTSGVAQPSWGVDGFGFSFVKLGDLLWLGGEQPGWAGVATYGHARRDLFWNKLKLSPGNEDDPGSLGATSRAGQMVRTSTFSLESGRLHYLIRGAARAYAAVDSHIMITGPLHGQLVREFDTGQSRVPKWVTHDLRDYREHRVHVEFGPVAGHELEVLMVVDSEEKPADPSLPAWPGTDESSPEAAVQAVVRSLREACEAMGTDEWGGDVRLAVVADWMMRHPELLGMQEAGNAHARELETLSDRVHWESRTAVAWMDGSGVDEHVLVRGKPFRNGELAPRALPEALPGTKPISSKATSGRLELAAQLVDPANPLVARVMVNRVWHHLFGRGIVSSVDNLGYLGERPTHPELLDHLAWQFVHQENWSLKRLVRKLVLSRTYAMDSVNGAAHPKEVDPANRLWHRMPVRRLEAEVIRDALLTVSGRFNPVLFGPPVPVYLTEFVVGRGRPDQSGPLDGGGRRSIYTAVRRNFLPTFMLTFDYPPPFTTMGRRNVTNVPAQSLALMNDELFHEQARFWAERLLRETPEASAQERIGLMFETAYGRAPAEEERVACLQTLQELQGLREGTQVWAELAHALLSANEFVYVR